MIKLEISLNHSNPKNRARERETKKDENWRISKGDRSLQTLIDFLKEKNEITILNNYFLFVRNLIVASFRIETIT